ncbi:facilitated trehalose transporter Tret1-2 isoform X1 [Apis mellifera carnica]|uniref:Facilitated trehalose transporter Tret1-2 homolog isoform X1 n=2 Tax=Apis mellifera TaxID=7460 RepID=A0A7M7MTI5_APIME|nr:facilitated trehalose transporter Tret1-2 homolog isoform X1 [Apis mellifera]XP_026300408.1 facilitated trehalose transporter Tret1-2 homolog isoform X1 [Apis mellifera]KAG9428779.1 facilitated trehalose transporter Tret1-2 isoform X1 [Apis mellifera carnica]|eukprot:XP_026300407.1 facilitated trehalose transporter Tret1-2 homolog isoform X1 [Apis mellifera]
MTSPIPSEECCSILGHSTIDYTKVNEVKNVCEDIENNNTQDKDKIFNNKDNVIYYSSNSKGIFAQCLLAGAVLLVATSGGMPIGYSATLLPQLAEENGTMHADQELGSWIASVHSLATPIGSLMSGPLLDGIGRRGALQFSAIPLSVGWFIIGFATNIPCLLVGRVVLGFGVGLMAAPAQVFLGEMADPKLRGLLTGCTLTFYCLGIVIIYALGASFTWDIVAFCGIIIPTTALIALLLIPESPAWLVRRKKPDKARKALLWLRGNNEKQVEAELEILESRAKLDATRMANTSLFEKKSSVISTLLDPSVFKPLTIINIFNFLQLLSGTFIMVFYAVNLVTNIGGDNINSYLAAVITAIIRLVFSILASFLLLRISRRYLGIFSAVGSALASFAVAIYISIKEDFIDIYIVGILLLLYVATNTVGLMALPGLMVAELLPQRARGIGGGFNYFVVNSFIFIVTKIFPMVNDAVGVIGVFIIFGISSLVEGLFIYIVLPETKNRTLQEIEDYFQQDNLFWITRSRKNRKYDIVNKA